jgi:outer membrane protein insertion porin family
MSGRVKHITKLARETSRVALVVGLLAATPIVYLAAPAFAQEFRFNQVTVTGNQRVDTPSVVAFAGIERGQTVSAGALNEAYQRIVNSGLFESVEITPRGNTLQITVQEWPTINRINIEGNRRIDDEDLIPTLSSQTRRVYNPAQAEADAESIAEAYGLRGRIAATVEPRIIRRSDNRVDLVFEVTEGRVVEIQRISFIGNQNFSERRLRNALQTSQAGILRTFIQSDTFVEERIAFDRQVLTSFYKSRGYVDFEVLSVSSQLARQRNGVFLTFNVREGQSFDVGAVSASTTLSAVDAADFEAALRIKPGETWSPALIENNIARLERLAIEKQLNFIRVVPQVTRNDADGTLDVNFLLERGPRVFIERIDIEGNSTTLDRVIRRQFNAVEGDPFNPREIRQAAERIRALGFFSDSQVNSRQGSGEGRVIVDVDVEEAPTGSLSFGGTYSVQDGVGLAINLSERNFLGRGQFVSFSYSGGTDNRNTSVSFAEPAFLDRNMRLSFDASFSTSNNDTGSFDTEIATIGMGLEFPVSENGRLGINASLGRTKLFDTGSASDIIIRETGERDTHSIGYTYSFDSRRSGLDPNTGVLLRFGQEVSGVGTTNQILRTTALASAETKVFREDVTLRLDLEGGMLTPIGGATTRITDRFIPDNRTLRGFQGSGVGPRDNAATNADALGGNYFAVARLESQFPLGLPDEYNILGGLFMDVGSVWGLQDTTGNGGAIVDDSAHLRATLGFAVYWTTGLGPLRFNFTTPLLAETYDRTTAFDLTISTQF